MDIYDLLDELYFLISFEELSNKFPNQTEALNNLLKDGLQLAYIAQYQFDNQHQDYTKQSQIHLTNLHQYHYLATKEGLLFLNGIG